MQKKQSGIVVTNTKAIFRALLMALSVVHVVSWAGEPAQTATEAPAIPQMDVLDTVEVKATADDETATGHVDGYVAKRSATATKTDTPIIETPRSISVITSDQMQSQSINYIDEALRYTAGVATEYRGIDRSRTDILIRGFDEDVYTDGMRADSGNYDVDPYGLERVEVLKGPASILYGAGSPGGMVNLVSKRPIEDYFSEVEINAGSYSQRGAKLDINGALNDDKSLLGRLTATFNDGETQVDYTDERRVYIAPALSWKISDSTLLTLLAKYQKDEGPAATFLPAIGTVFPNPNGRIPMDLQIAEPNYPNSYDTEYYTLGYFLEHVTGNDWLLRHSLRYNHSTHEGRDSSGFGFVPGSTRIMQRGAYYGKSSDHAITTDTNFMKTFAWGRSEHTLLIGLDYRTASATNRRGEAAPEPSWNLDIFNPVYGVAVFPSTSEILRDSGYLNQSVDSSQTGIYIQDQARINQWVFSFGGRYDRAKSEIDDHLAATEFDADDSEWTSHAGILYLFESGFAPYVSYAESFQPELGTDVAGRPFEPTTGEQYEAGIKYQPPGSSALITLSVFDITRQNILTLDVANPNFSAQQGEARTRGVEVEAKFSPLRQLDVLAAYSYLDTEITESEYGDEGNRFGQTPKWMASMWANYQFAGGYLDGLNINAGVRHTSSSLDYDNVIEVPSITLWDAGMSYNFKGAWSNASFTLNAHNLTDEKYVATCEGELWCIYGSRRVVSAGLAYRW